MVCYPRPSAGIIYCTVNELHSLHKILDSLSSKTYPATKVLDKGLWIFINIETHFN
jgi:hypothetical protein